ncbi:MAG: hypothetical protein Q8O89_08915 [Nanoarchaeota archaeon]|nr:hypothetical protein [Nanoarchaeota archaeon]
MRTIKSKSEHDSLVKVMADKLERDGLYVRADHIGHKNGQPAEIAGCIPDVTGVSTSRKIIVEAETEDTIALEDTRKQLQAFSSVSGAELHVIVPEGCTSAMEGQARQWGIRIDKYWHLKV